MRPTPSYSKSDSDFSTRTLDSFDFRSREEWRIGEKVRVGGRPRRLLLVVAFAGTIEVGGKMDDGKDPMRFLCANLAMGEVHATGSVP